MYFYLSIIYIIQYQVFSIFQLDSSTILNCKWGLVIIRNLFMELYIDLILFINFIFLFWNKVKVFSSISANEDWSGSMDFNMHIYRSYSQPHKQHYNIRQ